MVYDDGLIACAEDGLTIRKYGLREASDTGHHAGRPTASRGSTALARRPGGGALMTFGIAVARLERSAPVGSRLLPTVSGAAMTSGER